MYEGRKGTLKNVLITVMMVALAIALVKGGMWLFQEKESSIPKPLTQVYQKYVDQPLKQITKRKENKGISKYFCEPLWKATDKVYPTLAKEYRHKPCDLAAYVPIAIISLVFIFLIIGYVYEKLSKRN